jgi:hypothetical protein
MSLPTQGVQLTHPLAKRSMRQRCGTCTTLVWPETLIQSRSGTLAPRSHTPVSLSPFSHRHLLLGPSRSRRLVPLRCCSPFSSPPLSSPPHPHRPPSASPPPRSPRKSRAVSIGKRSACLHTNPSPDSSPRQGRRFSKLSPGVCNTPARCSPRSSGTLRVWKRSSPPAQHVKSPDCPRTRRRYAPTADDTGLSRLRTGEVARPAHAPDQIWPTGSAHTLRHGGRR